MKHIRQIKTSLSFAALLILSLVYGLVIRQKPANENELVVHEQAVNPLNKAKAEQVSIKALINSNANISVLNQPKTKPEHNKEKSQLVKREVVLMGSQFVFIVEADKQLALSAISQASAEIKALESQLSSWIPSSDIARLNDRAGRNKVKVAKPSLELLKIAKTLSDKTQGSFDITIGPVWDVWPFRRASDQVPSQALIDQKLKLVDAQSIQLDLQNSTAYLPKQGMKVNLGAIGKGYAAQVAINTMKALGISRAAISAGGDLYLLGKKSTGPWLVELEHPRWPGRYIERFVAGDLAVATSGDAKQFIEKNGTRYSHILDPRTGWPSNDCQSVTVLSDSATEADAFATAVYVMGTKQGLTWVEQQRGLEALIVDSNGIIHKSSGWQALINKHKTREQVNPKQEKPNTALALKPQSHTGQQGLGGNNAN